MAKNKARKNKAQDQNKAAQAEGARAADSAAAVPADAEAKSGSAGSRGSEKKPAKPKELIFQVKTKRDADMIKAYILFTYRMLHPKVTARMVFYGIILILPGLFYFKDLYWRLFFIAVGAALILLGLFRQYISLAMTKKNDQDYINGTEFTYEFYPADAAFMKEGKTITRLARYKDITAFYYDDDYFYLGANNREMFLIPKRAFTVGDPSEFEDFIYKKGKKTCRWIPNNFRDRMAQRRAARRMNVS